MSGAAELRALAEAARGTTARLVAAQERGEPLCALMDAADEAEFDFRHVLTPPRILSLLDAHDAMLAALRCASFTLRNDSGTYAIVNTAIEKATEA